MTDDREILILKAMKECRHFNGVQHDTCKAGVNYESLGGTAPGLFKRLPCSIPLKGDATPKVECSLHSGLSREEAEQHVDEQERSFEIAMKGCRAVHDDAKAKGYRKGKGGLDACPCPICQGTIRYTVASVNGHIWARCSTDGCVMFIE